MTAGYPTKTVFVGAQYFLLRMSLDKTTVNVLRGGPPFHKSRIGWVMSSSFGPKCFVGFASLTLPLVAEARKFLLEMQDKPSNIKTPISNIEPQDSNKISTTENITTEDIQEHNMTEHKIKKVNMLVGKCYLIEVTGRDISSVRLVRSNLKKELAIRLLTHATANKVRMFGHAAVTLVNALESDMDYIGTHIRPGLFVNDDIDGRFFCLLCGRSEALELLREYKDDPRYQDVHEEDVPAHFQHQLEASVKFREQVIAFEELINEKWPVKAEPVATETTARKPATSRFIKKSVTVNKAEFIRANPALGVHDLVDKAGKLGITLTPKYIYTQRAKDAS